MILSASRRTDIPCFYSDWLMERLRQGSVMTRNPFHPAQIHHVVLSPDIVDCIVFWTKDPWPMMHHLDELDSMGYAYYFQFTLTPYGRSIERNLRAKSDIEDTFIQLSKRIGRDRIVWRYDPIILNDDIGIADHRKQFGRLCQLLSSYTDTVVISFIDLYIKNRHAPIRNINSEEIQQLSTIIADTSDEYGLKAVACCESGDLSRYGINQSACIDKNRIERIIHQKLNTKPDHNQRHGCGCCESIDIGAYNTCMNGCVYCYANSSPAVAHRNHSMHQLHNPTLTGAIGEYEVIRKKAYQSDRIMQMSLFDDSPLA